MARPDPAPNPGDTVRYRGESARAIWDAKVLEVHGREADEEVGLVELRIDGMVVSQVQHDPTGKTPHTWHWPS